MTGPPKRKRAKRVSTQLQQPVSHTRRAAPEGWHPRSSSGLYMCAQTGTHLSEHICTAPLCQHKRLLDSAHVRLLATRGWFLRDSLERSIYSQRLPVPQPIMPLISPLPKMLVSKTNWGCGVGGTETKGLQMGMMASISHWPYIAWQLPCTQCFRHFSVMYAGLSR